MNHDLAPMGIMRLLVSGAFERGLRDEELWSEYTGSALYIFCYRRYRSRVRHRYTV